MKPSERILTYCAVGLTLLALTIWLKFFEAKPRAPAQPATSPGRPAFRATSSKKAPAGKTVADSTPIAPAQTPDQIPTTVTPSPEARPRTVTAPKTSPNPHRPDTPATMLQVKFDAGAVIRGKVLLHGPIASRKEIKTTADPHCTEPLLNEDMLVNEDGDLRNAIVFVAGRVPFNPPKDTVLLDQRGCRFEPHVLGLVTGQSLLVRNSDDTLHNVHLIPADAPEINKGQPARAADLKIRFTKPALPVLVQCDVHPWMRAYVGVFDNPYFAVTGEDGAFIIGALPAGAYLVGVWHEFYGRSAQEITVAEREVKELDFIFEAQ